MTTIMDDIPSSWRSHKSSSQKLHTMKVVLLHRKWKGEGVGRERGADGDDTVVPCSICMKNAVGRGYSVRYHVAQCHELKDAFYPPETAFEDEPIPTCIPLCDPCYDEHIDSHYEEQNGEEHFLFIDPLRRVFVPTGGIYRGND